MYTPPSHSMHVRPQGALNQHLSGVKSRDSYRRIASESRVAKGGGGSNGGFPDLACFVLFCPFWDFSGIFPICPGMVWGFSRFVFFLFLGLLTAP